ncbi:clasp N terminal-domain-containing protein [Dactylonectria macrodidyma]|uniref:Clasp N terminal-domain-containing protein n=1 Tax=Dactylonectria macrodidyma TaxID=307937 RepID=A0A9P9FFU9_9HYPO|nr:clasp N terminal-domain-containing protein [Dactylonectria macrodidyma]
MADVKVTDQQVADLVTILRGDGSLDSKVQFVTAIKSGIKQHNVPETSVAQLFDALRAAATSQHAALVNAGFTALNHLLTRLSRQDPKVLGKEAVRTLPVVIEKLGDHKDKFRSLATHSLVTLYPVAAADVERFIRNTAMGGKNPRAKESAMAWLLQMHQEQGLTFRTYVPVLMELLEDADGMVRDAAKGTVIDLFRNAPNTAKSDLKRQLKNFKVRPAIEQAIVKELAPSSGRPETPAEPAAPPPTRPALSASVSSISNERPITPGIDTKPESLDPLFVNTNRELDEIFKEMAWFFEGRESEQNWLKREEYMGKLRRLNVGNAPADFADTFLAGLRGMLDGIIKSITSLRTSLSKEGCCLVQDMAATFGPAIDPMVELLMQTFIKLSAGTKKISSQLANVTVDIILSRVTYTPRLMQHIWIACQDKNVAPRTYSTGWLKTILRKEAQHKNHVEHTGGVDLMEKCIKKGLADANPAVREKMRSTYWAFWAVWPARADLIMSDLEGTAQKLLSKDPNNPNTASKGEPAVAAAAARPGLGLSKSTMGTSKPSLREAMLAQRKANLAAKNMPARPGSAMSHFSPVKTTSNTTTSSSKPSGTRTRPEATTSGNAAGMSGAPMRPTRKRPDIPARPATAGPYSVRGGHSSTEAGSPESIKSKAVTPKPKDTTPRRTGPRTRPGHASHASESSLPSPSATRSSTKATASPRVSPAKLKQSRSAMLPSSSPSKANEDFTLVVPNVASLKVSPPPEEQPPATVPVPETAHETVHESSVETDTEFVPKTPSSTIPALVPLPGTPTSSLKVYEDPFTDDQATPKPTFNIPVLEDRPVNADAATLLNTNGSLPMADAVIDSPEKARQSSRLLDSGIARIKSRTLDVHGFRKLQSLLRESKGKFSDEKFEALLIGLFQYLEDPLPSVAPEKAQDVKAQILATIKLLLRKERDNFQPHVSKGLESLLETRSAYDTRAHIVSGLEVLADELVTIGDGSEIVVVLTKRLEGCDDAAAEDSRILSTGLHVLRAMLDKRPNFMPTPSELGRLASLASRCLNSADSGVRMDAVQLCVTLHARVGEGPFWDALKDVKDDPKSLITYYIVKRQREQDSAVPI